LEPASRYISIILIAAGLVAAAGVYFVPEATLQQLEVISAKTLLAMTTWAFVAVLSIIIWRVFYLPEPLRFILTARRAMLALSFLYGGGITFALPSAIRYVASAKNGPEVAEKYELVFEQVADATSPSVVISIVIVCGVVVSFLTWLYVFTAKHEKLNGPLFSDR
jgi:hypothetical protein